MKRTVLALALGLATYATESQAGFAMSKSPFPIAVKAQSPKPQPLLTILDNAIKKAEQFNVSYADLLERVEQARLANATRNWDVISFPSTITERQERFYQTAELMGERSLSENAERSLLSNAVRPPALTVPTDVPTQFTIRSYSFVFKPPFAASHQNEVNIAAKFRSWCAGLVAKRFDEANALAITTTKLVEDYQCFLEQVRFETKNARTNERLALEVPQMLLQATDPIRSRGLLEEYKPYDLSFNDRLWIQRMHHQHRANAALDSETDFVAEVPADEYEACVRESELACSLPSENRVVTETPLPLVVKPLPTLPSNSTFVVRRLPIDYTIVTQPVQNDDSAIANLMPPIASTPSKLDETESLRQTFGPSILPAIDLQPVGLAALRLDSRYLWKHRDFASVNRLANSTLTDESTNVASFQTDTESKVVRSISQRSAAEVSRSEPPSTPFTTALRGLVAIGLSNLKSMLSNAYSTVSQLESAIATEHQTKIATNESLQR